MTRVAAIGEAMIELSIEGETAKVGVAGDTLNTAIYLKRAAPGIDVDYVTCLGDDPFSDQIEDFIAAQDIGTNTEKSGTMQVFMNLTHTVQLSALDETTIGTIVFLGIEGGNIKHMICSTTILKNERITQRK